MIRKGGLVVFAAVAWMLCSCGTDQEREKREVGKARTDLWYYFMNRSLKNLRFSKITIPHGFDYDGVQWYIGNAAGDFESAWGKQAPYNQKREAIVIKFGDVLYAVDNVRSTEDIVKLTQEIDSLISMVNDVKYSEAP